MLTLADTVPVLATLAWKRSLFPGLIHRFSQSKAGTYVPVFVFNLLDCPLCLCFHLSWIWIVLTQTHASLPEASAYVLGRSVSAYTLHNIIDAVTRYASVKELQEALLLQELRIKSKESGDE